VNEDEAIDRLCADFRDDFRERIKFVKLCWKGDLDGDDDDLLWHFTRFSILRKMLVSREIWLSDLRGPRIIAVAGNRGRLWGEQHRIETRTKRNHSRVNSRRLTIGGNYSRSP
jgi:hypothetical protein